MDVLAHGLWAGAAAKAANKKKPELKVSFWQSVGWGAFPDLFAFTVPFGFLILGLLSGSLQYGDIPIADAEPPQEMLPLFAIASQLYSISHSLIVFTLVFAVVFMIRGRPLWELGGWFIHILLDIPTHTYDFYPTPLLWPVSEYTFSGFPWATPWFMALNYSLLAIAYLYLRKPREAARAV